MHYLRCSGEDRQLYAALNREATAMLRLRSCSLAGLIPAKSNAGHVACRCSRDLVASHTFNITESISLCKGAQGFPSGSYM